LFECHRDVQLESIRQRILWQPSIRYSARPLEPVLAEINRHFDAVNVKFALQKRSDSSSGGNSAKQYGLVARLPPMRPILLSLVQNASLLSHVGVAVTLGISDVLSAISRIVLIRVDGTK
jgi:hypothetical protein